MRNRSADVTRAFTGLPLFTGPVKLLQPPDDPDRFWLAEKRGMIWRFDNDDATTVKSLVIDLTDTVYSASSEMGLLGFAFHPAFAANGFVYVSFTSMDAGMWTEIVRFTASDRQTLDPNSALTVFRTEQPYVNHNGGDIAFGPDGLLYIGLGDGGSAADPHQNAQNTYTPLGALLRLDVDAAIPYGIPPDNPFADGLGGLPEVYAWGLRNPWRWSFDRGTGDLWLGDVGQWAWEEIDRIERGGNYGWRYKEGGSCYLGCDAPGLIDPVIDYGLPATSAVIGGYVYRGAALPDLVGTYVFTDYYAFGLYGIDYDTDGLPFKYDVATDLPIVPASFAEDLDGELYVVDFTGKVWRIVPATDPAPDTFPRRLSETGCFVGDRPSDGMIPYAVNAALWSDGATKERALAIPDGTVITVKPDGDFDLPIGTVLAKTFRIAGAPVETRLFLRHADGAWAGYAYAWDGDDAILVDGALTVATTVERWRIPSRAECLGCHTEAAGRTLGLEIAQLNRDYRYANGMANQLITLASVGMLVLPPSAPPPLAMAALASPDSSAPVVARARAYLHANCSGCHRPDGPARSDLDFRAGAADGYGCGREPIHGDLGVDGSQLLSPGNPDQSVLSLRMQRTDAHRMPPLGTALVDLDGTTLVDQWIREHPPCP